MKKSQILAALALAFALGVVAPVAGTYAYNGVPGLTAPNTQVNTSVVEVTNLADLTTHAESLAYKSVKIKYTGTSDINMATTDTITIADGQTVEVDLGGKTIVAAGRAFEVKNGSLTISNGTIDCTTASNTAALLIEGGETKTDTNGVAYASRLIVAANATIKTTGYSAILIQQAGASGATYGAVVDIYGTVESIATNGNIIKEGAIVNIHNGAKIEGKSFGGAAIYGAGVADWNIDAATITGVDGIYAKAGTFNLNGTTVKGTGAYNPGATFNGRGQNTGAALDIEVNAAYAGKVTVNVDAGTTLESEEGYAIYQFVNGNAIEALNISKNATVTGKKTVNGASIQGIADDKISYEATQAPSTPNNPETPNEGNNAGDDTQDPSAPGTGIVSTAEGNAATTVSIVAGLATALTALGAGVVAYRSARRSNK